MTNKALKRNVKKESSFWDSFSKFYDRFMEKTAKDDYKKLLKKILSDIKESINLLEMATGTGEISIFLSDYVKNITAIDFAPKMLEIAECKARKKDIKNISFKIDDCLNLDIEDQSFDTVICSNALHLFASPKKAIEEMYRVLKKEGQIIVPTYCHGESIRARIISALMGLSGFKARTKWSLESYKKFISDNGFTVKEVEIYGGKMPLAYVRAVKQNE